MINQWIFTLLGLLLLFDVTGVVSQGNSNRNFRPQKRKPTPTKKTVGGRWIPLRERLAAERRKQNAAKQNKNNKRKPQKNNLGSSNIHFDNLIQPPLLRSPNEVALQEPSWTHCLHNVPMNENWAVITSPNFPKPIQGQMQCTWLFEGIRGKRLQISFNVMDLQGGKGGRCGNQFIDLIDLELQKSQGRFCGDRVPGDYVSVGRTLRLDIQGDTAPTPHTGFQAAVRVVSLAMQPGLRQRSTMYHGTSTIRSTSTQQPKTRRPAVGSTKRRLIKTSSLTISSTTTSTQEIIFGQIFYGPDRQPRPRAEINKYERSTINTTLILYIFIGFFCFLVLLSGIMFIFRKQIYAKYKKCKRKNKDKDEKIESETTDEEEETAEDAEAKRNAKENSKTSSECLNKRLPLPESNSSSPRLDGRRRKSVVFEDEVLAGIVREPPRRSESANDVKEDDATIPPQPQQSLVVSPEEVSNQQQFQGWNYPKGEPIYEDDSMSAASFASSRSTSRQPNHSTMTQQKMMEKNNALRNEDVYAPATEPIYHIGVPAHHPNQNIMSPPFYPGSMPPFFDPYNPYQVYPQMLARHESFANGRPMMPPNYNESQQDTKIEVPPPIYDDYHQGRLPQPSQQLQKSQDDIDINKQNSNAANQPSSMKPSTSMSNLSMSGEQYEAERGLVPSQSMATLPRKSQVFPGQGIRQRSQSFTM